jgi:hypothetical protein
VNGNLEIGTSVVVEVGGVNIQPKDWRRSAEPEVEVDARLPCYSATRRSQSELIV